MGAAAGLSRVEALGESLAQLQDWAAARQRHGLTERITRIMDHYHAVSATVANENKPGFQTKMDKLMETLSELEAEL